MKLGIMQPYFIPYIGYWQLMNAVDKYVIYDDVNFIKGGWINRNRILINGEPKYYNIPMLGASSFKKINEVGVNQAELRKGKNLRTLEEAYKSAPYFKDVFSLMEKVFSCEETSLAAFIENSFKIINNYLGITTQLIRSSNLEKDCTLRGQTKVIEICRLLGATEYYNAIGGQELYSYQDFNENGIKLSFLKTDSLEYKQFGDTFYPNLSILDIMMFNSRELIQEYLKKYTLISE